eukprot:6642300-Alexandrium_andersonii.AAC.1
MIPFRCNSKGSSRRTSENYGAPGQPCGQKRIAGNCPTGRGCDLTPATGPSGPLRGLESAR